MHASKRAKSRRRPACSWKLVCGAPAFKKCEDHGHWGSGLNGNALQKRAYLTRTHARMIQRSFMRGRMREVPKNPNADHHLNLGVKSLPELPFKSRDAVLLNIFLREPVVFLAGAVSGFLALDIQQDLLKSWIQENREQ